MTRCLFCKEIILSEDEVYNMNDGEGNAVHYNCAIAEGHTCPTKEPRPPWAEINCPKCGDGTLVCLACGEDLLECCGKKIPEFVP